jgi:choline transporter-like protein 2/4/5
LTKPEDEIAALQGYNLFACFWITCFVSGLSAMTISGAFASYYFALRKPKDIPSFPVIRVEF